MRAFYVGNREAYRLSGSWRPKHTRWAEMNCEKHEEEKFLKTCEAMLNRGWNLTIDNCWALCFVDDRDEFSEFMADWKECKKEA